MVITPFTVGQVRGADRVLSLAAAHVYDPLFWALLASLFASCIVLWSGPNHARVAPNECVIVRGRRQQARMNAATSRFDLAMRLPTFLVEAGFLLLACALTRYFFLVDEDPTLIAVRSVIPDLYYSPASSVVFSDPNPPTPRLPFIPTICSSLQQAA